MHKLFKTCRICTKHSKNCDLENLFVKKRLLAKIEEITGILLKNVKFMPEHICKVCRDDLDRAYEFRVRCIKSQEFFNLLGNDGFLHHGFEAKVEMPVIGEINQKCDKAGKPTKAESIFTPEIEIKDELPIDENNIAKFCPLFAEAIDDLQDNKSICYAGDSSDNSNDLSNSNANADNYVDPANLEKIPSKRRKNKQKQKNSGHTSFFCDQCGMSFSANSKFLDHQRRLHTGEKIFNCEICPAKFFSKYVLRIHVRKHNDDRPYACEFCDLRFLSKNCRTLHIRRRHTKERPYPCSHCSKAFAVSWRLKEHMVTHTGEKKFRCDVCDMWFGRNTNRQRHYKSLTHKQNVEKLQ